MSEVIEVSSEWLALREPEDARARSRELARAAADRLGPGPIAVHDLGSGTGSMMRWLAPLLPGPQTWVLHDWNPGLVERAADGGVPVDRDGRPVRVAIRSEELSHLEPGDLEGASLVTASALLDVLTLDEIRAIARACVAVGCPALLSLSVTGRVHLGPADARDDLFAAAFNAHQQRRVDGRALAGPSAVADARRLFVEAGWNAREETTFWRLGRHDPDLLAQWFDGWLGAAVEQRADFEVPAAAYRALRASHLRQGVLTATVVHTDLLVWP
ncbi:SAM-dependent methyltransferase [Agromyces sp. MMS24-JH15]|uniref:SAM-dependent methyltransferase n=1 Tax=Agromyces sp. MMS24-JH15 TaxID=3243765 RepID=UPI003747BC56